MSDPEASAPKERVIVEFEKEILDLIERERRHSEGKIPTRAAVIRDLIREACEAREAKRQEG